MRGKLLKKGERTALIVTVVTAFLALTKGVIGLFSGSIALISDALHSLVDTFTIFSAFIGLKIAGREPNERFPYGYYKAENIATLLISGLILYGAFEIATTSYNRIFTIYELNIPLLAMSIAIMDGIIIFYIGTYEIKVGEKINSQSLMADGKESRIHILSSSAVLVSLISNYFGISYVDGIVGILISLLIFKVGIDSMRDSIYSLMDAPPRKEIERRIIKIIGSVSGVEGFGDLRLRKSGPFIFGEVVVKIRKYVSVERAHEISDNLENKIKNEIERIDSFSIHIEPYEIERKRIAIPVKEDKGPNSKISEHFGRAKYFMFVSLDKAKIAEMETQRNRYRGKKIRAGFSASNFIIKEKIDTLITKEIGEISFHILRDNLVDIYNTRGKTVGEVVDNFMNGKLERASEPTKEKD